MRLGKRISRSWEEDVHMKPASVTKRETLQQENATLWSHPVAVMCLKCTGIQGASKQIAH